MVENMNFKIHTPNFLKELCDCGLDRRMGIYNNRER